MRERFRIKFGKTNKKSELIVRNNKRIVNNFCSSSPKDDKNQELLRFRKVNNLVNERESNDIKYNGSLVDSTTKNQ